MLCISRSHLALHDELVSKAFQGRHGRAYLFNSCINISVGPKEDRILTTGTYALILSIHVGSYISRLCVFFCVLHL